MAELALVREAGVQGDLRQGQVRPCLQELLGPLDAAGDDILVRRQPGGPLELLREVVGGIQRNSEGIQTPINSLVGAIVQGIRARGPEISPRQTVGVWQPTLVVWQPPANCGCLATPNFEAGETVNLENL